ncbi:hypothetical protein SAMN04489761_2932 [Tenacibaculum sp. MAR_2009_124]|uniref:hypothetical protein n=1 Tax=Tenacibaculum sp. MAR_2009_124 TaxID=1250059 RepID=UPI000899AB8D|nr:hypothetical protein [Tenacibaculum sp. MAR_2009_124]SEC41613.1 hypothetical protein SAMN04489761_2932 [Tenacibaculum sp. MAR_2009_124]
MSHIYSTNRDADKKEAISEKKMKETMQERRWKSVKIGVTKEVLKENFNFLNDGVVTRSGAEGIPLMTTTGIYGPIRQNQTIKLVQGAKNVVVEVAEKSKKKESLLDELKKLREEAQVPEKGYSLVVQAKWISAKEGGGLPSVGGGANVFGETGSLLINESEVDFPVLEAYDEGFHETLAYYGAKLLKPNESFHMGFDKLLFGMEYDTRLPGYIQDYALQPYGGGGLFVEHHPFPHIWFPNPSEDERDTNICRVLLGRLIESPEEQKKDNEQSRKQNECPDRKGDPKLPKYHFTVFRIPTDSHALAVDECCIHNDSFCNGKEVVFIANTEANTVALRETAPYKNLRISRNEELQSREL